MDNFTFVQDQLTKSSLYFITKPDHFLIRCPIHGGGQERTPSRKINISNPRFKPLESFCYACDDEKKRVNWNELAAICNMSPIRDEDGEEEEDGDALWLSLPTAEDFYGSEAQQIAHNPWKGKWRGISEKLLLKLGATEVDSRDEPRLYLPVMVDGEEIGNVQCVVETSDESSKIKYLISKENRWSQYTLYPVDHAFPLAERLGFILLVEGARDALNLLQYGVPAVCIWGTNAWTPAKRDTIAELDVRVVIAMDNDEPGDKVREKIANDLKRTKTKVSHLRFSEEDGDPGKLKKADVLEILEAYTVRRGVVERMVLLYRQLVEERRHARKSR